MSNSALMDERTMMACKPAKGMLASINKIDVVEYDTMEANGSRRLIGMVGQTVQGIKGATSVDPMGYVSVEFDQLIPALVAAVQELSAKVAALEGKKGGEKTFHAEVHDAPALEEQKAKKAK